MQILLSKSYSMFPVTYKNHKPDLLPIPCGLRKSPDDLHAVDFPVSLLRALIGKKPSSFLNPISRSSCELPRSSPSFLLVSHGNCHPSSVLSRSTFSSSLWLFHCCQQLNEMILKRQFWKWKACYVPWDPPVDIRHVDVRPDLQELELDDHKVVFRHCHLESRRYMLLRVTRLTTPPPSRVIILQQAQDVLFRPSAPDEKPVRTFTTDSWLLQISQRARRWPFRLMVDFFPLFG